MINPAIPLLYARAKALRAQADALEMRAVTIHMREQQAMAKRAHTAAQVPVFDPRPDPTDALAVFAAAQTYLPSWREPRMQAAIDSARDLLAVAELILLRPLNKAGGIVINKGEIEMLSVAVTAMRSLPDAPH